MTNMPTSGISESYHELNSKLLNDRIVRSVSEVVQKEIECYLAERLKDYSLYKDTYEQIMNIGAYGGKLLGSGNGGFLMFLCPKNKINKIEDIFKSRVIRDIKFDTEGSHLIYP